MLDTTKVLPPTVAPPTRPLSVLQSIRAARRNVLEIIPELAYRQPMLSGRMGSRWHMVQNPGALRRVLLDNVENYPKSEVMLRMLRPAVGDSLFTSEGDSWRWQRRAVAPVFAQRKVTALAPDSTDQLSECPFSIFDETRTQCRRAPLGCGHAIGSVDQAVEQARLGRTLANQTH